MNKQTIIHGDCLGILKEINSKSIDCVIVDPPYGIDYQSARRIDKSQWKPKIVNDKKPFTDWIPDAYRVMKDNTPLICFTRWDTEHTFRDELKKAGFKAKTQIIWDKVIHGMGDLKGDFASQHENIIFAHKGRFTFPGKRPKSILRFQRVNASDLVHPNEKPVELMKYLIKHLTNEGDKILDCFMGVAPVGIASKELDRDYIGIELDPEYCEIAKQRLL